MSEEKKCFKKKVLVALTSVALLLSIISIAIDGVLIYKLNQSGVLQGPVVISKQYDKGQTMEKALKKEKPVIVWFYTDWCGFCQRFAPTFGKLTKDFKIKREFAVAYVNAELPENQGLMSEYQVQGFPTVYLLDPKTNKKVHVENEKLFSPEAKTALKKEWLEWAKANKQSSKEEAAK